MLAGRAEKLIRCFQLPVRAAAGAIVHTHTGSYVRFRDATYLALATYLPELVDYKVEILELLCDYFGVRRE